MKKFFPYILILIVLVGLFGPLSSVLALDCPPGQVAVNLNDAQATEICVPGNDAIQAQRDILAPVTPGAVAGDIVNGARSAITSIAGNVFAPVLSWIFYLIQKITALFMGLGGLILTTVLKITVVNMADNISGMTGINISWKIVRDLMNVAFIFMLVYEGIKLIVGLGSREHIRKFIGFIVLASILVNFSLFFTKVIIDASNIVTIGLYNSIVSPEEQTKDIGLSDKIQQSLGLQGFFSTETINFDGVKVDDYGPMTANIMAALLFLITAFVFFAVSILFVVRYIVLLLLLALSPVAYMGMALPSIRKWANEWWESLWGQVLFAPIFMLMIWVVLVLISSKGFLGQPLDYNQWTAFSKAKDGSDIKDSINLFFNFALVIGLTIASLITAKKYATKGSSQIGKFTNQATTFAGGAIMGGTARLGRNTVGRVGNSYANDEDLKKRAAEGSKIARLQLAAANTAATSTFDTRATTSFGKLGKTTGFDFGKVDAKKENFRAISKEQQEKEAKKVEQYKPSEAVYAEAKKKDEEAAKTADRKIKSAEAESRSARETYNQENDKIKKSEEEIKRKRDELQRATSNDEALRITKEIKDLETETKNRRSQVSQLENLMKDKQKAIENANIEKKNYEKEEDKLKKVYQDRVNAVAERTAHSGEHDTATNTAWRYVANTFGTVTNIVGITQQPKTKSDRQSLARKMRAVPQGKKKITAKEMAERGVEEPETTEAPPVANVAPENPPALPTEPTT